MNMKDYDSASKIYFTAFDNKFSYFGEHTKTGLYSLDNAVKNAIDAKNKEYALELLEILHPGSVEIYGEEDPFTLRTLHNLASFYALLKQYDKAIHAFSECYLLRKKVLGEYHPDTVFTLNTLAVSYSYIGNYEKAVELGKTVVLNYLKIYGEDHPETKQALDNLNYYANKLDCN